ncbi:BMP family lipoprotein [Humidisolicoccus flavus]|uniref:BMP family lipoprotein n=1 Tax=Humidisolicoccus flavus TaxID=3111414 RepID=UPI003248AEFA
MTTITRKAVLGGLATLSAVVLLAGCASAPEDTDTNETGAAGGETTSDFLPCIVSDEGGFDDKSFNQLSWEGLEAGAAEVGVETKRVESMSETDYPNNIDNLLNENCSLIIGVGYKLIPAIDEAAAANPDVNFALIDGESDLENVKPIIYDTSESAFLAGYAAASYSTTGKVATWGGINIPTVTIFMDGFAKGVEYHNSEKGTDVEVLGWDVEAQNGSEVGNFAAGTQAKALAETFIGQGADVLFPVGGPIYESAGEAIRDAEAANADTNIVLVGVDADLYESDPRFADLYLTSALKDLKVSTQEIVVDAFNGEFSGDSYVGTLENDGVGIADFHDFADSVDPALADELETIRTAIIAGDIDASSVSSPK